MDSEVLSLPIDRLHALREMWKRREERLDYRFAMVACTMANCFSKTPITIDEFLGKEPKSRTVSEPEEQYRLLQLMLPEGKTFPEIPPEHVA